MPSEESRDLATTLAEFKEETGDNGMLICTNEKCDSRWYKKNGNKVCSTCSTVYGSKPICRTSTCWTPSENCILQ